MSLKIQAPPANVARAIDNPKATGLAVSTDKKAQDTAKVGRDFEAILVRQMLTQVKVAGKGGYADMAVESLATSITAAGGLGLGRAIAQALDRTAHVATGHETTPVTSKK